MPKFTASINLNGKTTKYEFPDEDLLKAAIGVFNGTMTACAAAASHDCCCKASQAGKGKTITVGVTAGSGGHDHYKAPSQTISGVDDVSVAAFEGAFASSMRLLEKWKV